MKKAICVQGLFYGDEGKGSMTDFLCRHHKATMVVRFNGGCQAAHNVVTDEGRHHTFSQLGSGSFAGAGTYLSQYCLVNPLALDAEEAVFSTKKVVFRPQIIVSREAVVVTPFHRLLNRFMETERGEHRHGSVGEGIGVARLEQINLLALYWADMDSDDLQAKLERKKEGALSFITNEDLHHQVERIDCERLAWLYRSIYDATRTATFKEISEEHDTIVFEGAQGVMLDETHGFAPYNSWTDCTFGNVYKLLDEIRFTGEMERIAVMRTYITRHGNGPLITEDSALHNPELYNRTHEWMGPVRQGHFDLMLATEALRHLGEIEGFAITHMDIPPQKVCVGHTFFPAEIEGLSGTEAYMKLKPIYKEISTDVFLSFPSFIEKELRKPVLYTSHGPTAKDKQVLCPSLQRTKSALG